MKVVRSIGVGVVAALGLCLASPETNAHIGSSEKVNNRYYKLTPMADRVRIVYTIFYGNEPGTVTRRGMDKDRDGQLSSAEVSAYGAILQSEVFRSVKAHLGDEETDIRWKSIDMGMGTMGAGDGAFSADIIGTVCLQSRDPKVEHRLRFTDRLRLPKPGESELRLDPAPGIRVTQSVIGGREIGLRGHKWQGGPGPAQTGYEMSFFADRPDSAGLDTLCDPPAPSPERTPWWLVGGAAVVVLLGGLAWGLFGRRRKAD